MTPGVTENAITKNAITKNALAFAALTGNPVSANPGARDSLLALPLIGDESARVAGGTVPSALGEALDDPLARVFMRYLVECALPAGQVVHLGGSAPEDVEGQLGLCPGWATSGIEADEQCQELISSCLLARNNAFGVSVELSVRGWGIDDSIYHGEQSELTAFPVEEGAFYGNIFRSALRYEVAIDQGRVVYARRDNGQKFVEQLSNDAAKRVLIHQRAIEKLFPDATWGNPVVLYDQMWACSSPGWETGAMYARLRVCAADNEFSKLCAATPLGECPAPDRCAAQYPPVAGGCLSDSPPPGCHAAPPEGMFDYDDCRDEITAHVWRRPLTTFLAAPCDVIGDLRQVAQSLPREVQDAVRNGRTLCERRVDFDNRRIRTIREIAGEKSP